MVVNAFLDPIKFESYFPKIVALRFNLLVQTPGKIWSFRSDYNTLGSFFNFSKIDSLGETSHTFYFLSPAQLQSFCGFFGELVPLLRVKSKEKKEMTE